MTDNIVTMRNGRKAQVIETTGVYADTKANRQLNRVGTEYTKRRFKIMKGGALEGSEAGKIIEGNPEDDYNQRYDPMFKQASDT